MSADTRLAMLRRKMEGGGRVALEDLRRQEQDLLSLAAIEVRTARAPGQGCRAPWLPSVPARAARCPSPQVPPA